MDQNEEIFRARCCNIGNIVSFRARCCNMGNIVSFRARCCNMSLLVARRGDLAVSTRKTTEEAVQSGKIKERKRAQKVRSQARSFPQVPLRELGRVGRTGKRCLVVWGAVPQEGQRSFGARPILTRKLSREERKPERSWERAE